MKNKLATSRNGIFIKTAILPLLVLLFACLSSFAQMTVSISGNTTFCQTAGQVSLNAAVINGSGTFTYQWTKNGFLVSSILPPPPMGPPASVFGYSAVSNGDVFACIVHSSTGQNATSNSMTVSITQPQTWTVGCGPTGGIFLCQGVPVTFTASSSQTLTSYQWSMNGSPVSGATASSFATTASSATQLQSVSVLATATGSCLSNSSATGSASGIPFVVNSSVTPSVTNSTFQAGPECLGTLVICTAAPTNGGSSPSYQWMINGSPVSGATGMYFSSNAITNGQSISVVMTSNVVCPSPATATSNAITISMLPNVAAPTTPSGPVLLPQLSTVTYTTSGGNATNGYSWSISPTWAGAITSSGVATWSNQFTGTATVNASAKGCAGPSVPASLNVSIYPILLAGMLMPANVTISSGGSPGLLTCDPATGGNCGGNYRYQWQTSTNNTTWSNISDTTLTYNPGNLTASVYYRVRVACGTDTAYSNSGQITVGTVNTNLNFIRERNIVKPGVTDTVTANGLTSPFDIHQTTTYFDGLARPVQTVAMKATPLQNDMVSLDVYDPLGRESYKYMPYPATSSDGNYKANPIGDQYNFNSAQFPGEQYYYGQAGYEPSPLNRTSATFGPGLSWAGGGRGISNQYLFNTTADSVQIWYIGPTPGTLPSDSGAYPAGQLSKNVTVDEQGHQVVEYKNLLGHEVLKKVQLSAAPGTGHVGWLCTYYVYDDLDNLRFVIQPQAVQLIDGIWTISQTVANELCFRYEYDGRRRMSIKKIPGAGEVHMVYDARDRLVMSQDSMLRSNQKWLVTLYDPLNRADSTGLITDPSNYNNLAYHQGLAATSTAYPTFSLYSSELLSATYYDDYSQISAAAPALGSSIATTYTGNRNYFITTYNTSPTYAVPITPFPITRGMATGSRTEVVGSSGSQYLYEVNFYDDRGRAIQGQSINFTGGIDTVTTQYDFSGKPLRTLLNHQKNQHTAQHHIVLTKMNYDAGFRINSIYKNIDGAASDQLIDSMQYDELGQLRAKYLGNVVDNLVYDYNIRGWVTGINKNYVGRTSFHYFGMQLAYDNPAAVLGSLPNYTHPCFNGNIAGTTWRSAGDDTYRKYDYSYDNVNRLTGAAYVDNKAGSWGTGAMNFSVSGISYDANGNIMTMNQDGFMVGAANSSIDSLVYTYLNSNASNRLQGVTDLANNNTTTLGDFHYNPATKGSTDYSYDGNGNLSTDNNKAISGITYNYLNLPQQVTMTGKGTINYTYDAAGTKLQKVTLDNTNSRSTTTLYLDGFVYQQTSAVTTPGQGVDTLQFMGHEEGRARWAFHKYTGLGGTAYGWEYDFFEKDHLGNTRIVLSQEKDTAQYGATMEAANRNTENALFYNIPQSSYPRVSAPGYPAPTGGTINDSVARLNGSGQKVGPAIILKVMSGDKVDIGANYYYNSSGATNGQSVSVSDIINSLASGIVSVAGPSHGSAPLLSGGSSPLNGALNSYLTTPTNNPTTAGKPNAYLNWILLDNQFNYVSGFPQSGAIQVGASGTQTGGTLQVPLVQTGIPITKSGYLYIYVSNATPGWDVFFDNLSVTTYAGPMVEENHYYPFGLTMQGISDKALKPNYAQNKYRYNGKELQNQEFSDGTGLEEHDYGARYYDQQIGRWGVLDGHANTYPNSSPYTYALNFPTIATDPTGMDTHLEGDAAQDFFRQLQQESGLDGDQLDQQAQEIMDQNGGESDENYTIKAVLTVYQSITPDIYKHIMQAQLSGYPSILTRGTPKLTPLNRIDAFKGKPYMEDQPVRPVDAPFSADEYPFASTEEGGLGASLMWVPRWEQDIQRNQLNSLYSYIKQGDKFVVVTISSDVYPYNGAPAWKTLPDFTPSDYWIHNWDNKNLPLPNLPQSSPQVFPPWAIPIPVPVPVPILAIP